MLNGLCPGRCGPFASAGLFRHSCGGRLRRKGMSSEESPAQPEFPVNTATPNGLRFAALYADLRQLAERQLRRSAGAPISPTTLQHDAYLDMSGKDAVFPDRERFFGYAGRVMRGLIIDLVRERLALKRGGAYHITQLPTEVGESAQDAGDLTQLSDALDELSVHEPRLAEVVDLKYFCGFTFEEI